MNDVTHILKKIEFGEASAANDLLPLIYDELRRLAAQKLTKEKSAKSLQPTVLVHDAYLRLVDQEQQQKWSNRGHFFGAAAEAMKTNSHRECSTQADVKTRSRRETGPCRAGRTCSI